VVSHSLNRRSKNTNNNSFFLFFCTNAKRQIDAKNLFKYFKFYHSFLEVMDELIKAKHGIKTELDNVVKVATFNYSTQGSLSR